MIGMTVAHCLCQYWFHLEAEGPITKVLIEICGVASGLREPSV